MGPAERALLSALSAEAGDARARLETLAAAVAGLIRTLPADARGPALEWAQSFDVAGQELEALATILEGLSLGESADALIASVPLSGMAARLSGAPVEAAAPADLGDLLLFE